MIRLLLIIAGLGFVGFGAAFMIAPLETLGAAGIELSGDLAATELRAFYGGMELGIGGLLVAAALQPAHWRSGLWLCLASYGGIGLARLCGILIAGSATPFLWFALATELSLGGLAALGLWKTPKP